MSGWEWIALLGLIAANGLFVWWSAGVCGKSVQRVLEIERTIYKRLDEERRDA